MSLLVWNAAVRFMVRRGVTQLNACSNAEKKEDGAAWQSVSLPVNERVVFFPLRRQIVNQLNPKELQKKYDLASVAVIIAKT